MQKYSDLDHYCRENDHLKERYIAEDLLAIDPVRFSKLKVPGKYPVTPSAEEMEGIARLLGRPVRYVQKLYERAA